MEFFANKGKEARLCRKVEDPVPLCSHPRIEILEDAGEPFIPFFIMELRDVVEDFFFKRIPERFIDRLRPGEAADRLFHLIAELIMRFFPPRKTHTGKLGRQLSIFSEVVESGEQFARRQIACCPKNHDDAGIDEPGRDAGLF